MKTVYGTMADLRREIKDQGNRTMPTLLRSSKTDLPLGAYAPNGRGGGWFYSRRSVDRALAPSHSYAGSDRAYEILLISKKKEAESAAD